MMTSETRNRDNTEKEMLKSSGPTRADLYTKGVLGDNLWGKALPA
jgi:hypothetical protein